MLSYFLESKPFIEMKRYDSLFKGLNRSEITQLALEAWALQLGREQQGLSEKPISYGLLIDSRTLYVLKYDA